ncbi:hypothetical protein H5410_064989 [Solanum commersonii]|uniref:Uncharacterized protein n=1 Tax=Solanum commersonii TaxID=4109 RepID=A0A9J5VXT8_SOLCO|nr:hypothetical protein H5410_064989 [Solanum commersonii]
MDKMSVHSPTNVERAIVSLKGTVVPLQSVALLKEKTKEVIQENPKLEPTNSDPEDTESRSDENDLSIEQFTQHYNPNEDNDSGMSFDSEALHNLDT